MTSRNISIQPVNTVFGQRGCALEVINLLRRVDKYRYRENAGKHDDLLRHVASWLKRRLYSLPRRV